MAPFKIFQDECSIERLSDRMSKRGYFLCSSSIPDTAYESSVVVFMTKSRPHARLKIVVEKEWWPDGYHWEDCRVRVSLNGILKSQLDFSESLAQKRRGPMRRRVVEEIVGSIVEDRSTGV